MARRIVNHTPHEVLVFDKLTYAGNLASLAPVAGDPRYCFVARRHLRRAPPSTRPWRGFRPHWIMHLAAESHVDRSIDGPAAFIQTNVVGTYVMLEAALAYWRGRRAGEPRRLPLPSHLDRRSVRLARRRRPVPRGHALCAELALFGLEGRLRPSGARLAPHLRPADGADQLLQQLRALSFPGEAHPADDPQRARGQAAAGLRRGREHSRLAVRRRSRRGAADRRREAAARRELQYRRRATSGATSTSSTRSATSSTNWRRARAARAATSSPSSPTVPATTCATPSTARKIERELGWRPRETFETGLRKTVRWYLDNRAVVGGDPLRRLSRRAARRSSA